MIQIAVVIMVDIHVALAISSVKCSCWPCDEAEYSYDVDAGTAAHLHMIASASLLAGLLSLAARALAFPSRKRLVPQHIQPPLPHHWILAEAEVAAGG